MAALSNGFKHRHSKTDSSLESFLEPKNAKHFPALSVLFHSEAERLNFFGPLSPTKTRLLKLSRWAPAGQLLPLRTPRFMPSVFLTGFKGLVHPKNKKEYSGIICSPLRRLESPNVSGASQQFSWTAEAAGDMKWLHSSPEASRCQIDLKRRYLHPEHAAELVHPLQTRCTLIAFRSAATGKIQAYKSV